MNDRIKSDNFGIGTAVLAFFETYSQTLRYTGVEDHLAGQAKNDDLLVFASGKMAETMQRRLRQRGIVVYTMSESSFSLGHVQRLIQERRTPHGRLLFGLDWLEGYYRRVITSATDDVGQLVDASKSAPPAPPIWREG